MSSTSEIHQNPSDEEAAKIIDANYGRNLLFDEDSTLKDFKAFKAFNSTFRKTYVVLEITDTRSVVFKRDPTGKGGVVGFVTSWVLETKKDKKQFGGDTIEISEVTWIPNPCDRFGGHRAITRAYVAFGDPVPIMRPKQVGRKGKSEADSTISGRVVKRRKPDKLRAK